MSDQTEILNLLEQAKSLSDSGEHHTDDLEPYSVTDSARNLLRKNQKPPTIQTGKDQRTDT